MHPLTGPREKILWAKKKVGLLQFESQRFFSREVGVARVGEYNPKTRMHRLEPLHGVETPPEWGVWIGEIAHDLRSALDGLVYQLAKLNGVARPSRTEFPIFNVGRPKRCRRGKKGRTKKGKGCGAEGDHFHCTGRDRIQLLRREHRAAIAACQPYKRGNGNRRSPLWRLHQISNTDKHNLVVVVSEFSAGTALHPIVGGVVHLTDSGVYLEPSTEAEVEAARSKTDVYAESFCEITFGEGCDAVENLPVIQALSGMANEVSRVIGSFSGDFP